jgi:hypothetical protein
MHEPRVSRTKAAPGKVAGHASSASPDTDGPRWVNDPANLPAPRAAEMPSAQKTQYCDEDHTFIASQNLLEVHWA